MTSIRWAIIPGFLLGCLGVALFASLFNTSEVVQAAAEAEPAAEVQEMPNPECGLPARYPDSVRQWCGWIEREAASHGLDARLIAAVILQESGGSADAYSKSGAVGLMQVMPRDGIAAGFQCVNGPCFANRPSMDELFQPEFNIIYGTRMLAGLIQKHGNERDALKAYGPKDVGYYYADIVLNIYQSYQ
ncbi:MAG: transglycosylase SLT domain-containing protein [Chloroflexi bacterium]|nr:transglycosylase SLT domain-containing protein [Chloroflexota bacterium]